MVPYHQSMPCPAPVPRTFLVLYFFPSVLPRQSLSCPALNCCTTCTSPCQASPCFLMLWLILFLILQEKAATQTRRNAS